VITEHHPRLVQKNNWSLQGSTCDHACRRSWGDYYDAEKFYVEWGASERSHVRPVRTRQSKFSTLRRQLQVEDQI